MINISFKLRNSQKKTPKSKQIETPVLMVFSYGFKIEKPNSKQVYKPVTFSTGEKIIPAFWNGKRAKQIIDFNHSDFNTRLDNFENGAKRYVLSLDILIMNILS